MGVTAEMIKKLRELTGAGVLECKNALESAKGDADLAQKMLRERGLAKAARRAERVARQGLVEAYVHLGKTAALVELNCETDFVARTPEFKELAHDLAMQVVAGAPQYVRVEDVPQSVVETEQAKYRLRIGDASSKPPQEVDATIQSELEKFYQEVCLAKQLYIRDQSKTIQDLISERIASTGENIVLRRFVRFELSEE
jgi:elongation factor Ts